MECTSVGMGVLEGSACTYYNMVRIWDEERVEGEQPIPIQPTEAEKQKSRNRLWK